MVFATVLFTAMGICARLSAHEGMPWAEVALVRSLCGAAVAYGAARARRAPLRTHHKGLSWARSLFGTAAAVCTFYTLGVPTMAMGDIATIGATSPLLVALLSPWALAEQPSRRTWWALGASFVGVTLVLRPGHAELSVEALAALGAAGFSALAMVSLRRMRRPGGPSESSEAIALHFALVSSAVMAALSVLSAVAAPATPSWTMPSVRGLALALGGGVAAGVAQLAMTQAYAKAEAARLGVVSYLGVLLTHGAGLLLLGEQPSPAQAMGSLVVVASGLALALERSPSPSQPLSQAR